MLWSIDTCPNKVSTDQYHMTISWAQVRPYRGHLFFFFKLSADQGLVVDWIAGSSKVRHSHTHLNEASFFALFLWLDAATQPFYVLCYAFRVQVRFGKTYFSCIFGWFQSRFNII